MQQNCAQISKYIRHTGSMLFAQFVNLNDSPQTNGHLFSRLLRKKFCTKLVGEVLAKLLMSLRTIPHI